MENLPPQIEETSEQAEDLPAGRPGQVIRDYLTLVLGAGTIIFLDTWTKQLVNEHIPVGGAWLPDGMSRFLEYFRITHLHNRGTAFSMFDNAYQINIIISVLAALVALVIIVVYPRINPNERALRLAILLQLGGTIGNLISRIQFGYVLDFISVGNFAVFNIADSSLVVGASLMVLAVLFEELGDYREKRKVETPVEEIEPQVNPEDHS